MKPFSSGVRTEQDLRLNFRRTRGFSCAVCLSQHTQAYSRARCPGDAGSAAITHTPGRRADRLPGYRHQPRRHPSNRLYLSPPAFSLSPFRSCPPPRRGAASGGAGLGCGQTTTPSQGPDREPRSFALRITAPACRTLQAVLCFLAGQRKRSVLKRH